MKSDHEVVFLDTDQGKVRIHVLKTWSELFSYVVHPDPRQRKTLEIRRADRDFRVGDFLLLHETLKETGEYTGRWCYRRVSHILDDISFVQQGFVAMSLFEESPQTLAN